MTGREYVRRARIDEHRVRRQWIAEYRQRGTREWRRALLVQGTHAGVIRRCDRQPAPDHLAEAREVLHRRARDVVVPPLEPERRPARGCRIGGGAGAAATVRREDGDVVLQ